MTTGSEHKIANPQAQSLTWLLPFGIIIGLGFLVAVQLSPKWFLFLFLSSLMAFVTLAIVDRKKFFLALLVFAIPIGLSKTFFFTPSMVFRISFGFSVYLAFLPLLALYVIWIYRRVAWREPLPLSTVGLWPLFGIFAMASISVLIASNRMFAAFDLFSLAFMLLLFIYVSSEIRDMKELRLVLVILILTGVTQAVIAIGQNLTGSSLGLGFFGARQFITGYLGLLTLTRVTGTLGHPSSLAEYFDLVIPVSFAMLFYPMSRGRKFLLALGVFIEFIGLGMSYSRGGIFWTIAAVGFITLVQFCRRQGALRGTFTTFAMGFLFVFLLLVVPNPLQKGLYRTEAETAYGRLPLMKVAYGLISHHPLLGVGLNNYVPMAKKYDFTPEQLTTSWNSAVHNVYLFIAGEIGLPGLLFFICLVAVVLRHLYPALRSADPFINLVALGVMSGLAALLIHWMTDLGGWASTRWFWFMLGLAVAVGRLAGEAPENIPAKPDKPNFFIGYST
ncbi:MAG: O-antigen ligase family protein [Desulfobaccales bacterium]